MRSLFVTMYRKVVGLSTNTDSTNRTDTSFKRHYINHSSTNEEHGLSRLEANSKHYWRSETGTSAVAYHGEPDLESASNTDGVGRRNSDNEELLPDQHMGIMKKTEVSVSETRR